MLTIKDLSFSTGNEKLLSGIDLTIDTGCALGVLGRSGAGKTLFLKSIADLIKYTGSIHHFPSKKRKTAVQYFQRSSDISDDQTVSQLLKLSLKEETPYRPVNDLLMQRVEEYLTLFDLPDYAHRELVTLPDSIYKISLLASHFIREKPVLLLDNPDAGLAPRDLSILHKGICRYLSNGDRIVIIASHNVNFISNACDRIILLNGGLIAADGNNRLIDSDLLKRFYGQDGISYKNIATGRNEVYIIPEN
jgi:ABC-type multidrug transport system ATPase subunit